MKLNIHELSKSFGSLHVLNRLNAELSSGHIYCLMGPSGSGKTTLLRILMGLEKPDSGSVTGTDHIRISAVFQEDRLCEAFTPVENVMMVTGHSFSETEVRTELCRILPEESLDRPVSTLSGGMKRRTAICRALLAPFDLLLMDEPFTGLDETTRRTVISFIKSHTPDKLVILSTHQEEDLALLEGILITLPWQ